MQAMLEAAWLTVGYTACLFAWHKIAALSRLDICTGSRDCSLCERERLCQLVRCYLVTHVLSLHAQACLSI